MTQYLPPNLLALFAPREPLRFLPPACRQPHEKKTRGYSGVAQYLDMFEVSFVVVVPNNISNESFCNLFCRIQKIHHLQQRSRHEKRGSSERSARKPKRPPTFGSRASPCGIPTTMPKAPPTRTKHYFWRASTQTPRNRSCVASLKSMGQFVR